MRVIPDLVTTHRVVAPDLPGHGTSELVDGRLDATNPRDQPLAFLEALRMALGTERRPQVTA